VLQLCGILVLNGKWMVMLIIVFEFNGIGGIPW